jgi:predicted transcriptional regulator
LSVQITNLTEKKVKHQQHQSESITFRLDSIILDKLQREAGQKDTSVNALVSQVIRRHVDWHSNAAKAGFVTVRRGLLINLINRLSEKDITSVAEYTAKKETKDFVLLLRNEYSMESALDVIETWIKISGHPYRHEVNYTTHSYVIQHDMGRNWSLYMAEQYRFLFEQFELKKVDFDMTDSTLDFVVDTEKI